MKKRCKKKRKEKGKSKKERNTTTTIKKEIYSKEGTSRQRSGKGAIRKRFPLQKTEAGKNQTNNQAHIP